MKEAANITTNYDAIVETEYSEDVMTKMNMNNDKTDIGKNYIGL